MLFNGKAAAAHRRVLERNFCAISFVLAIFITITEERSALLIMMYFTIYIIFTKSWVNNDWLLLMFITLITFTITNT